MTGALVVYSATFMRYSLAVSPKNYLLFACHAINFTSQSIQGYRYLSYWKYVRPKHPYNASDERKGSANLVLSKIAGEVVRRLLLIRAWQRERLLVLNKIVN
jgi:hypothetical protein